MTASSFRAFLADTKGEAVQRGVATRTDATTCRPTACSSRCTGRASTTRTAWRRRPTGRVARISPIVPGIDLAGVVAESDDDRFPVGAEVLAHGYDLGVSRHGGFAEYARVPADWLVPVPSGLTLRDTMVIGTAGYTAALSVVALEERGLTPADGPVLVTGATGGVGSTAVGILANRGYEVVASTGKADAEAYLRALGAKEILDRATLSEGTSKPLESTMWAAAVDCVGSTTLANVLPKIHYGGAVACSGVTGGGDLPTTMMPFVLRGVSLLGIDSVQTPIDRRRGRVGATRRRPQAHRAR